MIPKIHNVLEINGQKLSKKYVQSLSKSQRQDLIPLIFAHLREVGFLFPDDSPDELRQEYQRLIDCQEDINSQEIYNNSSIATSICQFFCPSFFYSTERNKKTLIQVFEDDELLKKTIGNRLGLDWLDSDEKDGVVRPGVNESFNLTYKQFMYQGPRSQRLVPAISMFKPNIAKWIVEKYSQPGDTVGDYSCGFGGRLLGALSVGRKYIGTDPLTVPELQKMVEFFGFKDVQLIQSGSENWRGEENSVDLYWSSPPYFEQELYSYDTNQAYNKGEDYFYSVYWQKTLENIRYMLKPGKWFGLNVKNVPRMLEMAKKLFGEPKEQMGLKTVRSHLTKTAGNIKHEYVYMFINDKGNSS